MVASLGRCIRARGTLQPHPLRWAGVHLLDSRQRLSGVDNARRLTRVMVVLCNRIHGVVGVGPFLVDTLYSTVPYGAAVVPGNFSTHWNRLERSFLRCSHDASRLVSKSALTHDFIGSVHDFVRAAAACAAQR